jgi:DNA mismatch repair protein MutS2
MDPKSLDVLGFSEVLEEVARAARSGLGAEVARRIRPTADRDRLGAALDQLREMRGLLEAGEEPPLLGLGDVASLIARGHAHSRALEPPALLAVRSLLEGALGLGAFFRDRKERVPVLAGLAAGLAAEDPLVPAIDAIVEAPGLVRDRASPRLWELRRRLQDLEDRIRAVMVELVQGDRYRDLLQERNYSVRNGRYVLPVRQDRKGLVSGILHDKSASGETAYIEPREVIPLANDLAETRLDESAECSRLLLEISRRVYAEEGRITAAQRVLAWFDFTFARARFGERLAAEVPALSESGVIRLRRARHPLLLLAEERGSLPAPLVPATLSLGEEHDLLVVTGPNTGGKTVLLKTLGLIQAMFQAGLPVPVAPGSELPCLQGVFADIGDEQSLSQNLSTFSGHVRNIARILEEVRPPALVLLDELGAGTDPAEGAALGEAILDELLGRGLLGVVTTHLLSLKEFGFSRPRAENAGMTFDTATLQPTFGLVIGEPGSSQALAVARRHGLPGAVVEAAERSLAGQARRLDALMERLAQSRVAAEQARQRSETLLEASAERLRRADLELQAAEQRKAHVETEAESELRRLVTGFREAVRPHLNALKNVPKSLQEDVAAVEAALQEHLQVRPFGERRREFLSGLKRHDEVYVPRFGQIARVEKLNRAEERLSVRLGNLLVEIPFDEATWVTPPRAARPSRP